MAWSGKDSALSLNEIRKCDDYQVVSLLTTCIDTSASDRRFIGRMLDRKFISELPDNCDPCGENKEYHSFVFDGPVFEHRINYTVEEVVLRDTFYCCDLM
jgi:diphthamide synthase (EF-2-diphthine--ammonia ligase)